MSQDQSDNIKVKNRKKIDEKTGVWDGSPLTWRPYNNVAEFFSKNPFASIPEGQFFDVRNPNDANKSDVYVVAKDRTTAYKVVDQVNLLPTLPTPSDETFIILDNG